MREQRIRLSQMMMMTMKRRSYCRCRGFGFGVVDENEALSGSSVLFHLLPYLLFQIVLCFLRRSERTEEERRWRERRKEE
jgi:hypothetical protein